MEIFTGTPQQIAAMAAGNYVRLLSQKPDAVLGFATGETPLGLYAQLKRLCADGAISFKDAKTFNLDEYVGLEPTHEQSYRYFMDKNLFEGIDIPRQSTHVPSGKGDEAAAADYEAAIANAGGIDLQLLGIGRNGHIGFNEPGTPFDSLTHKIRLTPSTINANSRFFASEDEVPKYAISMGIKTVMNARAIVFIALGKNKAETVARAFEGEITPEVPASILQLHPFVKVYLDHDAASLLKKVVSITE